MRKTTSRKPKNAATISDVEMTWLPVRAGFASKTGLRSRRSTVYQQIIVQGEQPRASTSFRLAPTQIVMSEAGAPTDFFIELLGRARPLLLRALVRERAKRKSMTARLVRVASRLSSRPCPEEPAERASRRTVAWAAPARRTGKRFVHENCRRVHFLAKNWNVCYIFPIRRIGARAAWTRVRRERDGLLETFCIQPETRADFFV
jgi:hypothetical protein